MSQPLEGGCACGAIRYRCDAEPVRMFKCHCVDCQRASGGPFVPALLVPIKAFKFVKGTPTYYATPSARGGDLPKHDLYPPKPPKTGPSGAD